MSVESFEQPQDNNEADQTVPSPVETASTGREEDQAPEEQDDQEQEPAKTFTQAEMDAIIGERLAKERRAMERKLREQQNAPPPLVEPKLDQFKTPAEYIEAAANYKAQQIVLERDSQKQQEAVLESYADREDAAKVKYKDFDKVYALPKDGGPAISQPMAAVIRKSEVGPEIAYYLANNVPESFRIHDMEPLDQAVAIARIEAKLSPKASSETPAKPSQPAPKPASVSSAPAPIEPVGQRSTRPASDPSNPKEADKMDMESWMRERNKQISKKK